MTMRRPRIIKLFGGVEKMQLVSTFGQGKDKRFQYVWLNCPDDLKAFGHAHFTADKRQTKEDLEQHLRVIRLAYT